MKLSTDAMTSPMKSISPGSAEEKRFLFESNVKESFIDFREMCLNFRSTKHRPNFEAEELRSPKRVDKKTSSFKLQVQKVGGRIKVDSKQLGLLREGPKGHQCERTAPHSSGYRYMRHYQACSFWNFCCVHLSFSCCGSSQV